MTTTHTASDPTAPTGETEWVYGPGDADEREVPLHRPEPGDSVFDLADRLGVRVINRGDPRPVWTEVLCAVAEDGRASLCVRNDTGESNHALSVAALKARTPESERRRY